MASRSVVLVTGAAGFIGSHVADALLRRGDAVVGLDNFDDFYSRDIKERNLAATRAHSSFELVEGDIRDAELLHRTLAERTVKAVLHLAARAGVRPSIARPELYADVNVRGTATVLEAARRAGVDKVVYASSSSVYGARATPPFTEDGDVDHPVSPYAATKRAAELLAFAHHQLYGGDVIGLRFFTVYGPRQRPDMAIAQFTRLIDEGRPAPVYGDGEARRDFTYIDDIVQGVLGALDRATGCRVYNLGESATTTVNELVRMIGLALGKTPQVERRPNAPGDVPLTYADIRRARSELGYDPQVPLAEGLRRYVAWRRAQLEA